MSHPPTTDLAEAIALILEVAHNQPQKSEMVYVMQACNRIAAETLTSAQDLPQTDNAAVDGYAVHQGGLSGSDKKSSKIVGIARAGHPYTGQLSEGEAVRIFTGAIMPSGPNCVVMHEDCTVQEDRVTCHKELKAGMNIRPRGENLAAGEQVIAKGQKITAADMGQIAAAGHRQIKVYPKISVSICSTGDEIIEAGLQRQTGQIFDSNRPLLSGLLAGMPITLIDGGIIKDNHDELVNAYQTALACSDIIISTGGASDGIEDHTQAALKTIKADLLFWRLAIKPGRPMAAAHKDGKLIFCLPGNPVAAFVCFRLLVMPTILARLGAVPKPPLRLQLPSGFHHKKTARRTEFLRAKLIQDETGRQRIHLHGRKGAGVISSLAGADGLVEIPLECTQVMPGDLLNFLPLREQVL